MPDFGPQLADAVLAACQANTGEAAAAFSRAFDQPLQLEIGALGAWTRERGQQGADGAGLVVVLPVGAEGAAVLVPEAGGILPPWAAEPDVTGQSKLATLAQELGLLLVPEDLTSGQPTAVHVAHLGRALERAELAEGAPLVPLRLSAADGKTCLAALVWPVLQAAALADAAAHQPAPAGPEAHPTTGGATAAGSSVRLPGYSRSLLRIKLPVMVTLAHKKQAVGRIVELVPGSILQFAKSCDELLDLEVGGQRVACGECVKVGDKFGLRISSVTLPAERFVPVGS